MKLKFSFLSLITLVVLSAQISLADSSAGVLAQKAISENVKESSVAIAELRSLGPSGLQALLDEYKDEINEQITNPTQAATPEWSRISAALDAVSQQKNSYLSGLYWYTDLDEALKVSRESGRAILSLRLLGKLSEDLSCANSRFFRTVLYTNSNVSAMLRSRFILHWKTVRPVPIITIDFGDGRKLERTITGNSIHYILDSQGRLIEGLPGVYGPQSFARILTQIETLFNELQGKNDAERQVILKKYYSDRINKISVAWLADNSKIGGKAPEGVMIEKDQQGEALRIMPLAVSKAMTEATMLRAMTAGTDALGRITDEVAWTKLAQLHIAEATLDERSVGLIKRQTRNLPDGGKSLDALLQKFQTAIALDTVRNEYKLHTQLYAWLLSARGRSSVDTMNEKVYAELFLTPKSDPWLGLLPLDVYTGIENAGVISKR